MGRYRDRLEIVADILSIVSSGARKTRIMYQANLSYRLLCRYLTEVLDARLVRCNDEDRYVITPKGEEFLSRFEKYSRLCKGLEEQLNAVNGEKSVLEKMCVAVEFSGEDARGRGEKSVDEKEMGEERCRV